MSSFNLSLLPMITDENQFFALRQKLSIQPTAKQTQMAISLATVNLIQKPQNITQTIRTTIEATVKRNNQKFQKNLFVHFTHEARLKGLAHEIHMIHDSYFKNTIHENIRLVVGHRNNPNIEFELAQKRPSSSLLKDPSKKSKL